MELGLKAAAEVEQQLPILKDKDVTPLLTTIGGRLVAAIPQDLRHPEFQYRFQIVNVSEINAFALPGGPMYVNRGMIEAAHTEGEVAGVMAHELSHVALRHGTAQATKAAKYELGTLLGAVVGAVIGGNGEDNAILRRGRRSDRRIRGLRKHVPPSRGLDPDYGLTPALHHPTRLELASLFASVFQY